ncbi:hypothetical protein [Microbaculum marinisediminis]|uniref:Uncharacterized protein n=1 Tax=Microbaculum marinisediminis TaxID=2931392 RepID=A0AAW5R323_9HYPH|nr:hypothetical protein [Microbaculum sp. A6E488]MCT8973514.1 hypothetical protein [Microbaculum sp. A6E488]
MEIIVFLLCPYGSVVTGPLAVPPAAKGRARGKRKLLSSCFPHKLTGFSHCENIMHLESEISPEKAAFGASPLQTAKVVVPAAAGRTSNYGIDFLTMSNILLVMQKGFSRD